MRLLLLALVAACATNKAPAGSMMTGIVAHRGASQDAPENTLAALRRAWALGAESCEIDVRVTADGEVVLMHDADTRRIGGRDRPVVAQTLAELRQLDVGAWKAPAFRGERIATLGEALDATPAGHMLFVEIKTGAGDAAVLAAAILAADPRRRGATVALQAYDPLALAAVGARLPGVETYWTVDPPQAPDGTHLPYPPGLAAETAARGFTGVAVHHAAAGDDFVDAVKQAGLVLDVWTVNDAALIARWRTRARWVETDQPALAKL